MVAGAALATTSMADDASTACEDAHVRVQGGLSARWIEPLERACLDLRSVADRDPSAGAEIVQAGDDVIVEVMLTDGRSTLRRVSRTDALTSTLRALLTLPPPPPSVVVPDAGEQPGAAEASPSFDPGAEAAAPSDSGAPPTVASVDFGVEVVLDVAARVSGPYVSAAYRLGAELQLGAWLLGVAVRWEPFQWYTGPGPDGFEMDSFGASIVAGHRWPLTLGRVDAGLAVSVLQEGQNYQIGSVEFSDSTTSTRLGGFGRLVLGRGPLRFLAQLDAELVPARLRRNAQLDSSAPFLPAWSLGLGIGLLWAPR